MKTAKPRSSGEASARALILASASSGRATVLESAGLSFRQIPAAIDERAIEARAEGLDSARLAALLAGEKARAVSLEHPDALVLGADQVMECCGEVLHKPVDLLTARAQLTRLRGQTHRLFSALAIASGGEIVWDHVDKAELTMRDFSDAFLDAYLAAEGEAVLWSVGSYRVESRGIQLFSAIDGDHFTIIGLPLLPLLAYLRISGWLPA